MKYPWIYNLFLCKINKMLTEPTPNAHCNTINIIKKYPPNMVNCNGTCYAHIK